MSKKHAKKAPVGHAWEAIGRGGRRSSVSIAYQYCDRCGLIRMRNDASELAASAPCSGVWPVACVVYRFDPKTQP